jgi:hypothetical protein
MALKSPEEYRRRAQRARDLAAGAKDQSTAETLRRVAADYDRMADQLETQSNHEPETSREQ